LCEVKGEECREMVPGIFSFPPILFANARSA
jgi:hypothetical protein